MASHFLLVVCCWALYLLATTEQQRQQSEKSEGGFRTVYDDCATTTEEEGDGDDDGNVAALSDPVSAYGRQIVCAICALQLSAPAPAQIVYDAFELCFKKKSQKKTRNRRDVIAKDDPPGEERLTARGDKWGQM